MNVVAVAAGDAHSLALIGDGPLVVSASLTVQLAQHRSAELRFGADAASAQRAESEFGAPIR